MSQLMLKGGENFQLCLQTAHVLSDLRIPFTHLLALFTPQGIFTCHGKLEILQLPCGIRQAGIQVIDPGSDFAEPHQKPAIYENHFPATHKAAPNVPAEKLFNCFRFVTTQTGGSIAFNLAPLQRVPANSDKGEW